MGFDVHHVGNNHPVPYAACTRIQNRDWNVTRFNGCDGTGHECDGCVSDGRRNAHLVGSDHAGQVSSPHSLITAAKSTAEPVTSGRKHEFTSDFLVNPWPALRFQ